MSKKRPIVVRAFAPDEEAKVAALRALIERTVPPVTPGRSTSTYEKPTTSD